VRSRRFVFIVAVAALVVVGFAVGNGSSAAPERVSARAGGTESAALASSNTVWFCPGVPPKLYPASAEQITFANIGDTAAEVDVTNLADDATPTHVQLSVAANWTVTRTRETLGGPGALTIETFGGRVVVEDGVSARHAFESTPCATRASAHWYFAAGSTLRGEQQWLIIANPYASDAKVNVTLRTSSGVLQPDELQAMDVARRSRTVVAVHNYAVRQQRVAIEVDAQIGTVVASQTSVITTDAGTPGIAQTVGSPAAASDWTFPGGLAHPDANAYVAIANVGNDTAQVDVQPNDERHKVNLSPLILTVPQDAIVWVQLGQCSAGDRSCIRIPDNTRYLLEVHSEQDLSIVAQTFARFDLPGGVGTVTAMGAISPARSFAFARFNPGAGALTTISVQNPGAGPASVDITLTQGGVVQHPSGLQNLTVAPGRQLTVDIPTVTRRRPAPDAALTLTSTQPVFAGRSIVVGDEASTSSGVDAG
jgi:hypothetical protein